MKKYALLLKYCILGLLATMPAGSALGQKDYYRLDGTVTLEGGDTYKYQLDFREKNGTIKGYSLTWLDDSLPSMAAIEGRIDRGNRTISFAEKEQKNMLLLKANDMCYFNGTLSYKQTGNLFLLSGSFTGLSNYAQYCGRGEITLSHNAKGDSLLGVVVKPKQPPVLLPKAAEEPVSNVEVITAASSKELDWVSDTCVIDIWDYGNVDGDKISVTYNGKTMLGDYEITSVKKQLRLPLHPGRNTIKITAENEGSAPPNTARLLLTDGKKQYSFTAYNTEGKSATIVLKKAR